MIKFFYLIHLLLFLNKLILIFKLILPNKHNFATYMQNNEIYFNYH